MRLRFKLFVASLFFSSLSFAGTEKLFLVCEYSVENQNIIRWEAAFNGGKATTIQTQFQDSEIQLGITYDIENFQNLTGRFILSENRFPNDPAYSWEIKSSAKPQQSQQVHSNNSLGGFETMNCWLREG